MKKTMAENIEQIRIDIALLKQDVDYIKKRMSWVEGVIYSVGGVIIMAVIAVIINFFVKAPVIK